MTFRPARCIVLAMSLCALFHAAFAGASEELRKDSDEASIVRGGIVFRTYCVLCHGAHGDGNGRTARMYNPRPANLTRSPYNDEYKELIIRRGGEGIGRSPFMPPWGEQLTDEQIRDVIAYLRSIKQP